MDMPNVAELILLGITNAASHAWNAFLADPWSWLPYLAIAAAAIAAKMIPWRRILRRARPRVR